MVDERTTEARVNGLTHDELIRIVVALDNEACSCDDAKEAAKLRNLKWKVFALTLEAKKVVDNDVARC